MRRYAFLLIAWALVATGCAFSYLPPVHQGNYLSQSMLRSVKVGMTEGQVVYLLGTPALEKPILTNGLALPLLSEGQPSRARTRRSARG
ncbi:secreted protein containing SmpA/OmlA domain protein, partial [mine drainage metagenome]